jgi:hypothetical protein
MRPPGSRRISGQSGSTQPRASRDRRIAGAFTLIEVLLILVLVATGAVVFSTLNDALYVHRTAAARLDRTATIGELTRALRRDVLAARDYRLEGSTLVLHVLKVPASEPPGGAGEAVGDAAAPAATCSEVRYVFETVTVLRMEDAAETHAWSATRLEFGSTVTSGPQADVLYVEFKELPPPRSVGAASRVSRLPLVLPPGSAAVRGSAGSSGSGGPP